MLVIINLHALKKYPMLTSIITKNNHMQSGFLEICSPLQHQRGSCTLNVKSSLAQGAVQFCTVLLYQVNRKGKHGPTVPLLCSKRVALGCIPLLLSTLP